MDFFNEAYRNTAPRYAAPMSIINFLETSPIDVFANVSNVLEIGCGECSIFEKIDHENISKIHSIDLSTEAINRAKQKQENSKISYHCMNLFDMNPDEKYDLIVDSHFYHCLVTEVDRAQSLALINNLLSPSGFFLGETMVSHKKMSFSDSYYFDQDEEILFKLVGEKLIPERSIKSPIHIEKELLTSFNIKYFFINSGLKFIVDDGRESPKKEDPDTLRFLAQIK